MEFDQNRDHARLKIPLHQCISYDYFFTYLLREHQVHKTIKFNMYSTCMQRQAGPPELVVCAIDIGSTYSGYAYAVVDDLFDVVILEWNTPSHLPVSYKTPTSLLLDNFEEFVAFGYEADSKYAELVEDGYQFDYFYYHQALVDLRREELTTYSTVKDITKQKEIPAIQFYRHIISFFRDLMIQTVEMKGMGVNESEIKWVLTVPAMWLDPAKQVITEAAEMAGISPTKIHLALEPETTCIHCSRLYQYKFKKPDAVDMFGIDAPFLLIDAGGGKVDFTVLEATTKNELKTLEQTSDTKCGGNLVDMCFVDILKDVVGEDVMDEFCHSFPWENIELLRNFEVKKIASISTKQTMVTMKISETLSDIYENFKGHGIKEAIQISKHNQSMKWEGNKMRITSKLFENLFNQACKGIIQNIYDILTKPKAKKVDKILLVGGFSSSSILQNQIRTNFPSVKIIVPNKAEVASLKGAVLYGLNQSIISTRRANFSYGVASCVDDSDKDGHNMIDLFVKKGNLVHVDVIQSEKKYETDRDDVKVIQFDFFASDQEMMPKYVTDPECQKLGKLTVELSEPIKGKKRAVFVQMIFGGTKLLVKAVNKINNHMAIAEFDFPGNEP